jgi:hypothetical protein
VEVTQEICSGCGRLVALAPGADMPERDMASHNYQGLVFKCSYPVCFAMTEAGTGRRVTSGPIIPKNAPRKGANWTVATFIGQEICASCDSLLELAFPRALHAGDVVVCPAPCNSMTELGTGAHVPTFVGRHKDRGGMMVTGRVVTLGERARGRMVQIETDDPDDFVNGIDFSKLVRRSRP